ncbi:MAG: hypothetical protein K2L34_01745 [Muribaculaceae bacterium]|nr:hypothetical protein [Muribaculaceae bacterium]
MNSYSKKAFDKAASDVVFARILTAFDPQKALGEQANADWRHLTENFVTSAWISAAIDYKNGNFKNPDHYASNETERDEVIAVQNHFQKYSEYAILLAGVGEVPFSDYLNGISMEDFRGLMQNLRGNDAAREIQRLYKEGVIADDLGGSQLHRYMKQLGLKYIPTVSKLNEARRGEISKKGYDMTKSRGRDEKFL